MRTLKIAMLATFYPPYSFGGDAIGVQRMSRALAARGHDVTVVHDEDSFFSLGGKAPVANSAGLDDGVQRIGLRSRLGLASNLLTQQAGQPVVHAKRIREILGAGAFDLLWFNNISLLGGPGLLSLGSGLKIHEAHDHWLICPTHVLWRHNREACDERECVRCTLVHRRPPQLWRWSRKLERHLEPVRLLIAKSEFSRRRHKQFGLKREMAVIPYFLPDLPPATDRERASQPHSRPYFLFVGRLEKIKGLQDVIPVFKRSGDTDLLIIGDGNYAAELRRLAGDSPRIHFLGRKSVDDLDAYYREAIALIVPSVCYETFGIILIESFRTGTPVIARRLGPFPEIVERCGGGLLFGDDAELEAAMAELHASHAARERMSRAGRSGFEKFWCEDSVIGAYADALAEAAHQDGRRELARVLEAGAISDGVRQL